MAMPFTAALTPRAKREVSKTFKKRLASFRANKLSTSDFFTDELEVFHKHGNRIWTENVTHFVHVRATGRIEIHGVSRDITDRKRAELALRESEERYRLLVDQLHVGVVVQTPTAEIVMANQKVLELLGLTEQEICGRTSFDPAWDVIHEDGAPFPSHEHPVPMAIRTLREVHNVVMGVFRPSTSDRIWILASASPQFEEDGALKQVICTFQDITGPRQQQEALRMAEAQNRAILAAIPDLVFINDRDHRFTFVHTPDEEALYAPPHASRRASKGP
jgi:PAS domain S-box-containing protein